MDHPEGAGLQRTDRLDFDPRVRLEFRGTQLSSDGGLLVMRELDDALGLSGLCGLIRPHSSVCPTADTARGEKRLSSGQKQAILLSSDRPLGECRSPSFCLLILRTWVL
jgi:hypothetical protein